MVAYADDTMVAAESKANLKATVLDLIEKSKDSSLVINENKTKYIIIPREDYNRTRLLKD